MPRALLVLFVLATGCRQSPSPASAAADAVDTPSGRATVQELTLPDDLRGISGLTPAGDGTFWAVPERDRRLFRIAIDSQKARVKAVLPIRGAPEGEDLESVAVLPSSPNNLVFGCETTAARTADRVVKGVISEDATVIDTKGSAEWSLDYGPWAVTPERNRGLEALCVAGEHMLTVSETVKDVGGRRLAPVAVRSLKSDAAWVPHTLNLTSKKGKISAVACRTSEARGLEAIAIERHFGVMRLIRFSLPSTADKDPLARPIKPELVADIRRAYPNGSPPNYEGIAWVDDRTMILISDNDYRGVTGPTTVLRLTMPTAM